MTNARPSSSYLKRMRRFSSKSLTGYVLSKVLGACSLISFPDMQAFRASRLETELRNIAFGVLRRLCGRIGHLPNSYLLSDKFDLTGNPCASGHCADIRMGVHKGRDVAVKSLRVSEVDDKVKIRKVGDQATVPCPGSLIRRVALLQRSCHVEELVTSQCSRSHRCD